MNSMTGFGIAKGQIGRFHFVIEARSVNHRFCEVAVRFPGRYSSLEPAVMGRVRQRFSRGKFDLFLREETIGREEEEIALAQQSFHLLKRIQGRLGLKGDVTLSDLLSVREIFLSRGVKDDVEKIQPALLRLAAAALDGLETMREREGRRLQHWFAGRLKHCIRLLASIERRSGQHGKNYRRRLEARLKDQLKNRGEVEGEVGERRVLQEAAIMAERADVTEEIVRLRSHLKEFARILPTPGPIGRRLDFLVQEMGREINTIGSKSQGVRLIHHVIDCKGELERIKEQIQNIE